MINFTNSLSLRSPNAHTLSDVQPDPKARHHTPIPIHPQQHTRISGSVTCPRHRLSPSGTALFPAEPTRADGPLGTLRFESLAMRAHRTPLPPTPLVPCTRSSIM
ncbi:hypothetical protein BaRGS_00001920 [Batillaria attramentaria]|uniref:Uncharacterized protein n=1 Tax=Batillaria attramentaria TaxID=370345 RepID=A0ABD0M6M7_9CAEN